MPLKKDKRMLKKSPYPLALSVRIFFFVALLTPFLLTPSIKGEGQPPFDIIRAQQGFKNLKDRLFLPESLPQWLPVLVVRSAAFFPKENLHSRPSLGFERSIFFGKGLLSQQKIKN